MSTSLTQAVPFDIVLFVIFVGAFALVMFAATWLIVERSRLETVETEQAAEIADLRARHARTEALIDAGDQRLLVWDETRIGQPPTCRGSLPANAGAPPEPSAFIAFGTWLTPTSARRLQGAVDGLRDRAATFSFSVETRAGTHLDVQGRASGHTAFVRFMPLDGLRAERAQLQHDHDALIAQSEPLRALLSAVSAPVWMREEDGTLLWANPAYIEAIEAKDIDQATRHGTRLLDPTDRDALTKELCESDHLNRRFTATVAGARRTMDVHAVALGDGGMAGIATDISEIEATRRRMDSALTSHRATLDHLATAIAIFDGNRALSFHNAAFASLWGFSPAELENEPDNARLLDTLRAKGKVAERADWAKWRDGWLETYSATEPRQDWWYLPDGRTLRIVATPQAQGGVAWLFEDMSEQLAMESRLTALHKVQGETLDHMNEAIAVFSPNGRLRLSNPAFIDMWGLEDVQEVREVSIADLAGTAFPAIISDQRYGRADAGRDTGNLWTDLTMDITGMADIRERLSGRLHLREREGDITVHDYALVPLPDGETMISFADVTDSVRMEEVLTERNSALETAEKLKSAFFEHVSYELRTPLTSIKGFADMLSTEVFGTLNDKQADYVGDIADASRELEGLVDNMLDLAIVDADRMELKIERLEIATLLKNAERKVTPQLVERRLTLRQNLRLGAETFLHGDAERLQQVLVNLLTNAVKFSKPGQELALDAHEEDGTIVFAVADQGEGVPDAIKDNIFERFQSSRAGGAESASRSSGAGLGLAIARAMVQLHDGTIELDRDYNEGARFVVKIPANLAADTAQAAE
jgi:signal transduction histidine kinase